MTLAISADLKSRRKYLQTKNSHFKRRLAYAYASGDCRRILATKIQLIRVLREQTLDPDLGPTLYWSWGYRLALVLGHGADPLIPWEVVKSISNPYKIAEILEASIVFESSPE
jgi:hypothetical protein